MKFIINKQEGYACSFKPVQPELLPFRSPQIGAAYRLAENVWNTALLKDAKMVKYYDHSDELMQCIEADLPVKLTIRKHINGFQPEWTTLDDDFTEMSIEEYLVWIQSNEVKWIDGDWTYVPISK